MEGGVKVRTLEALRAHFSLEKVLAYFLSGSLAQWLEDRSYTELAAKLCALDRDAPTFDHDFCALLGVPYTKPSANSAGIKKMQQLQEKEARLKQLTTDEAVIALAADTAFTQSELDELLAAGKQKIYLCGEAFTVPSDRADQHYIGLLSKPALTFAPPFIGDMESLDISVENVQLPEGVTRITEWLYDMLDAAGREKVAQLLTVVHEQLDGKHFDTTIDTNVVIEPMRETVDNILGHIKFDTTIDSNVVLEPMRKTVDDNTHNISMKS